MKKRLAAIVLLFPLAAAVACGGGASGVALTANWYSNTTINKNISGTHEALTYSVTFTPEEAVQGVSLSYDEGTYTVLFEDVTTTAEHPLEGIPVGFHGYHLHSELNMTGRYAYNGTKAEDFSDSVVSDVWFMDISSALRPIRSVKKVTSSTPNLSATSEKDVTFKYAYTYTVTYDEGLTEAKTVYRDDRAEDPEASVTEKTIEIDDGSTFFDNEQLLLVLRAVDTTEAIRLTTINPVKGIEETVASTGTPVIEKRNVAFKMNGTDLAASIDVVSFSFSYSGTIYTGRPQNYVYAKCTNPDSNTYRNVLLSMETYALDELGTFTYTLKEAEFTK